jgi:hypothetical protein
MDVRSITRTILAALVGLGIVIVFIVLMVKAFTGHGGSPTNQIDLSKYGYTMAQATLTIDAPTNTDQDHRQVKITVGATQNEIDIIQGYQGNVIASQTYANNSPAFAAFLESLKLLNFSKGSSSKADYRGYCPTGERYLYAFNDGQNDLFSYWSTSCGQGTFGGDRVQTRRLFERQVPEADFDKLAGDIPLG